MLHKDLHPTRLAFRKGLLGMLALSIILLLCVIGMRIHYRDGHIDGRMQAALFEFDVVQYKARALVGDDEEDMVVINSLLQLSIFSPIYADAGLEMLAKKADTGYEPAVMRVSALEDQGIQVRK